MPSNRTHDRITRALVVLSMGLIVLWWQLGLDTAFITGMSVLFGGYYLSPDLDIYSVPYRRWGWIRWIWKPYQRFFGHRNFWTHAPVVGTVVRLLWLTPIWLPLFVFFQPNWVYAGYLALGLEIAAFAHWLTDLMESVINYPYRKLSGFKS